MSDQNPTADLAAMFAATPPSVRTCTFGEWLRSLPEGDQAIVDAAFKNPNYPTTHVGRVLIEYGCPVGQDRIRLHRLGECRTCSATK